MSDFYLLSIDAKFKLISTKYIQLLLTNPHFFPWHLALSLSLWYLGDTIIRKVTLEGITLASTYLITACCKALGNSLFYCFVVSIVASIFGIARHENTDTSNESTIRSSATARSLSNAGLVNSSFNGPFISSKIAC